MEIIVTMERMLYAKVETKWYFFKALLQNTTIVCKGSMSWTPQLMETLALVGDWVEYKGERQFQFKSAKLTLPLNPKAQLDYVCERAKGIGPSITAAIWAARGDKWPELERGEIKKMSNEAYDSFVEQTNLFRVNKEKAEIVAWLESKGCTTGMAAAAFESWGKDTAGIVNSNCYRLADLSGYSFKTVDENVRRNFDIDDDDPRRIRAGVTYVMQQETEDGSTAVDCYRHLSSCLKLLPNIGAETIRGIVGEMIEDGSVRIFRGQNKMALKTDYVNESMIYDFAGKTVNESELRIEDADLLNGLDFAPDETQLAAVKFAVANKFAIINGGAGVGKTTVIKMMVRGIRKAFPRLNVALCAFAGKAAARLREASGIEATTIHSFLGSRGDGFFAAGPLTEYAVIIDESSMIDSALLAEIVKRNPARLILVGDQAQLTPVGHGQPFHDLIQIYDGAVRTLSKCYRNTEAVFSAATMIRNGNIPAREAESDNERWVICGASKPEQVQEMICAWAREGYLDFDTDIVLCPKNGTRGDDDRFQEATVNALNEALLAIDREKRAMIGDEKYLPGDRVINTKNVPEDQVWNGTTGTVHAVNDENEVFVKLDVPVKDEVSGAIKDIVRFNKEMVKSLRYAYALTVHKSQGSQYRKVIMAVLARDTFQLDRSLVYTGVTRTKEECIVVGDYNALIKSIQTTRHKDTVMQCLFFEGMKEKSYD